MYLHAYSGSLLTAYRHCPLLTIGHGHVPARIPGRAGAGLPALPLVKRPLTCTCIRASASWRSTYPALRPIDNRLQLVSVELARRLPALPPVDTRPQLCTCTHTMAGLLTAYRHCLPPTTSHGCARIPRQAGASFPVLPPLDKQPWTCTCTHASVSWRSLYRRCVLLTISSD